MSGSAVERLKRKVSYLPRTLQIIRSAAPGWIWVWGTLQALLGILPAASLYLTRAVVDSVVVLLNAGGDWAVIGVASLPVIAMALLRVLTLVAQQASTWVNAAMSELIQDAITQTIHEKALQLDLGFYETEEFYNRLLWARQGATSQPLSLLQNLGRLVQSSLMLAAILSVLLSFGVGVPLVIVLGAVPAFALTLRHTHHAHAWQLRTAPDQRRLNYYDSLLTTHAPAAEVRLYDLGAHFSSLYQSIRQRLRRERLALERRRMFTHFAANGLTLLSAGSALLWIGWQAIQGAMTLGSLALFLRTFQQSQSTIQSFLSQTGQIEQNTLFLENFLAFLNIEPQVSDPPEPVPVPFPLQQGITFQNVSFRYPGSERLILEDFSLHLPASTITAIVGANGAGKSTLTRLIARFYDPLDGCVTLDGVDVRNLSLQELRRQITIMFQFPMRYAATVAQNIELGDLRTTVTRADLETAAHAAGVDETVCYLPHGYDTPLIKWLGGVELSGGEWQRLALARASLRKAQIVILDEPTSSMDSWAETEWLSRFRSLVRGCTVILITHRFTTAMHADTIYVMDAGQIVESGHHEALLALGGRYARSWIGQMGVT